MGRPWLSLPTLQNRQNHAFFHVLAPNLLKNTRFSTFWLQNCSKTRVFPRFGLRIPQKHVCFHVFGCKTVRFSTFWLQNCSKTRVFQCFCFQSGSKPRVFPSFGFNIVQKRAFTNFFLYKLLQPYVFRCFWFEEVQKTTLFSMCFVSKSFNARCIFFTDRRLCTQVLRARKLLHTDALHTKAFTHRKSTHRQSTHRLFCTTNCFTRISFCTPKHLNTSAFYRGF